jgi:diguanylate cyclase (GGDEF)-like protein
MQISYKVALSITLVVAFAGGVGTGFALTRQADEQRAEFQETNEQALELLAVAIAPAMEKDRHERVQAVLDNIANFREERFKHVENVEVIDLNRRVVAAYDPTRFNDVLEDETVKRDLKRPQTTSILEGEERLTVIVPLRLKHRLGVMRAVLNQNRLNARIERQRWNAGKLLTLTMVLIAIGLHLIHRRLVANRLSELAAAAEAIEAGDLDIKARVDGSDEIADLGRSFNSMAKAVKMYTEDLEQIIDERTDELQQANKRLEKMATTDQLTGVWNRRYFEEAATRALEVARRNERPLCVALVDVDKFKSVNDTHGHPIGDEVLKVVAEVLATNARKADLVARIGGEEFAILMPESGVELAGPAVERMREALENDVLPRVSELGDRKVTASFGIASLEHADDRLEDLLAAADLAMYQSKADGRNRVTLAKRKA